MNPAGPARTSDRADLRPGIALRPVIGSLVSVLALAPLVFLGLEYLVAAFTHETTDDAFIEAGIVAVSPKVAGLVAAVHVDDNQWVNAGDPLVDLDARDYQTELARRKAGLAVSEGNRKSAEAAFELMTARLATAEAVVKQSQSEAVASQATADKAEADLKRAEPLRQQAVLSPQEFDQIRATAVSARATAAADRDKVLSDQSKVTEARAQLDTVRAALEMVDAQIRQADADLKTAELNLSYTHLVAPTNGAVTRKAVHVGEYVQVGQRLLAVVPTNVWVVANFKETQLQHLCPGQPVRIRVDAYPDEKITGHVDGIQAGSGARFSLLPPENAVGNYVKVVQRVPVKILFDTPPDPARRVGPGMSVVPSVRTSDFTVSSGLLALAAGALSIALVAVVWKMMPGRNGNSRASTR